MGDKIDKIMGKAKMMAGDATNNNELKAKGKIQETKGRAETKLENFEEN